MTFAISGGQTAAFAVAAFCTLVLPVVLLIVLLALKKVRLAPLALGFVSFFVSQPVLRIPLLQLLTSAGALDAIAGNTLVYAVVVGGLSAGLFEETARLAGAAILKNNRAWKDMVSFGLGHGLCEVMLLTGMTHVNNLLLCAALSDPAGPLAVLLAGVDSATLELVAGQLAAATPGLVALGLLERVSAVLFHLFATSLVFTAVIRRQPLWYFAAVAAHTFFNALAVLLAGFSILTMELVLLAAGLAMGAYVLAQRRRWPG